MTLLNTLLITQVTKGRRSLSNIHKVPMGPVAMVENLSEDNLGKGEGIIVVNPIVIIDDSDDDDY